MAKKKTPVAPVEEPVVEERVSIDDMPDLSAILPPSEAERDIMLETIERMIDSDEPYFGSMPEPGDIPERYVVAIDYGYGFDYIASRGEVETFTILVEDMDPWTCETLEDFDEMERRTQFVLDLVKNSDKPDQMVIDDLEIMLNEIEDARMMFRIEELEDDELLDAVRSDDSEAALVALQA